MIDFIKSQFVGFLASLGVMVVSFAMFMSAPALGINNPTTTITNPHNFTQGVTDTSATFSGTVDVSNFVQGGASAATSTNGAGTLIMKSM